MYWPCGVPQVYARQTSSKGNRQAGQALNTGTEDHPSTNGHAEHAARPGDRDVEPLSPAIIDVKLPRNAQYFATLTVDVLDIWSLRPGALLASLQRSQTSLQTYGQNVAVHIRPDGSTIVLQTTLGFLLLYAVEGDNAARVLQQRSEDSQTRKQSLARTFGTLDVNGIGEVILRFRKTIKIDAGVKSIFVTDQDFVVATNKPAAIQCIRWETQKGLHQTSTQLLSKMQWMESKTAINCMVHDRAMNLSVWIDDDGAAYAVRRSRPQLEKRASSEDSSRSSGTSVQPAPKLFDGYRFHNAVSIDDRAVLAAVNAKFSLIAVATSGGKLLCFAAKDYAGNIPLSHTFEVPTSSLSTHHVKSLCWSPDGYCLFAGFDDGWATWSVFGKEGASSFNINISIADNNDELWLLSHRTANWIHGGSEILITAEESDRIYRLGFSRSAAVGCLSTANLVQALQQTPDELAVYCGHDLPDLTSISNEASLWHHAQFPALYLQNQGPIRMCVISQDGRYVAISGRRGLAHYSLTSGRWRASSDVATETSFAVRGGMAWFGHILAVAVEHAQGYDVRLYSRDQELSRSPLHVEALPLPVAFIGPSSDDTLLVYTYENVLHHYIVNITERSAQLLQVGQIAFNGIVRAPSRVRSVSWILPDHQLRNGDPSRDVEHAAVLFLIDDKLVLLNPTRTPENAIKYDMRVVAHQVEYYILMRDQTYHNFADVMGDSIPPTPLSAFGAERDSVHSSLRDSLWIFNGKSLCLWSDVRDLLHSMSGLGTTSQSLLSVPVDFYPLSILLNKGVILGIESEILQRRDVNFAIPRNMIRTQLFLPYILRYQLLDSHDTTTAFAIANQYQHLSYFPHALEILLHIVLDAEKDRRQTLDGSGTEIEPLPAILSFLQMQLSPEAYLQTIVQCVRKTEFSFWRYLFVHLPQPKVMFEQALGLNDLKTASGYLIVMQTFEEEQEEVPDQATDAANSQEFEDQVIRLMTLAKDKNDFELCSELARFMIGIDPRGKALTRVVKEVGFRSGSIYQQPARARLSMKNMALQESTSDAGPDETSRRQMGLEKLDVRLTRLLAEEPKSAGAESEGVTSRSSAGDYFSTSPGDL